MIGSASKNLFVFSVNKVKMIKVLMKSAIIFEEKKIQNIVTVILQFLG